MAKIFDNPEARYVRESEGLDRLTPCPQCGHLHFDEEVFCEECDYELRPVGDIPQNG